MKHPVIRGHPVHAILSDLPVALVPTALLASAAERVRSNERTRFASDAALGLAFAGTVAAAVPGVWDWLTMPRGHSAWTPATLHGLVNSLGLSAVTAALLRPRRRTRYLALATGAVLAGGAIGGELVFRHGWRVRQAEELEIAERAARDAGQGHFFDAARKEVEQFERSQTFLPPA